MKLFFEFVFAVIFPFVYVAYFFLAVSYRIIKAAILHVVWQYHAAREEFERVHGSNIS
jgi:hypothetical protein